MYDGNIFIVIVSPVRGTLACEKYKGRVISAKIFAEWLANVFYETLEKKKKNSDCRCSGCYSKKSSELKRIPNAGSSISRNALQTTGTCLEADSRAQILALPARVHVWLCVCVCARVYIWAHCWCPRCLCVSVCEERVTALSPLGVRQGRNELARGQCFPSAQHLASSRVFATLIKWVLTISI